MATHRQSAAHMTLYRTARSQVTKRLLSIKRLYAIRQRPITVESMKANIQMRTNRRARLVAAVRQRNI